MSDRYGPQTAQIDALLVWGRTLTEKEVEALRDAWETAWANRGTRAAWAAGRSAARTAGRIAAWAPVSWAAGSSKDWLAAGDAVQALVVRDLIGQHGFTQEHFDTLVGPWESVMGTEWTREEA